MNITRTLIWVAWGICLIPTSSYAGAVLLPFGSTDRILQKAPANDLLSEDEPIDRDQVTELIQAGEDASLLEPRSSDVWTPAALRPENEAELGYPSDEMTVDYDSSLTSTGGIYRARVTDSELRTFRLSVSIDTHAALVRAALLRTLGYPIPTPRYYPKLKIRLSTPEARNRFLDEVADLTMTARTRWLAEPLKDGSPEVVLQDVVLEPGRMDTPPYHWGVMTASHLAGRRALRSLIVPLVLLDIGESINLYSWQVGSVMSNNVALSHPYSESFQETTFDDARWAARRMAPLTRAQWTAIAQAGHYPSDIATLLVEKMIARRNQLIELFQLTKQIPSSQRSLSYQPKISVPPTIKDGKVLDTPPPDGKLRPGYGTYFRRAVPQSPLTGSEIGRFLLLESITGALNALLKNVNDQLEIRNSSDVALDHQNDVITMIKNHLKNHPGQPLSKPVGAWVGPTGGFKLNASRNVVTGTYYGSESKIQLVDSVSAQASVGFFMGVDGIPTVVPGVSGNLMAQRSYLHVRPVTSAKAALKTNWKWLWVPGFMRKLAKLLETEPACKLPDSPTHDPATASLPPCKDKEPGYQLPAEQVEKNLKAFLDELQENEVFTVVDTVGLAAGGYLSIPIAALLGAPVGVPASINLGGNGQALLMRRTMFTRTKDGLQVYVQNIGSEALGASLDFQFWMKIFRATYSVKNSNAHSSAYLLGDMPKDEASQRKMLLAIKGLLKTNNRELLEESYSPYEFDHDLPSQGFTAKLLRWRWSAYEESHRVKIRPPEDPQKRYNPKDKERTLFSQRYLQRSGTNNYSFVSDIIDGIESGYGFDVGSGDNPANSFFGKSKWHALTAEAETTPSLTGPKADIVTISERHWQGWILPKTGLFKIFDQVEAKLKSLTGGIPLIRRDEFNDLKQLEMYDIQATLLIYQSGVAKLRDAMIEKLKVSERTLYNFLVELDGKEQFRQWCRLQVNMGNPMQNELTVDDVIDGNGFTHYCMKPWMRRAMMLATAFPVDKEAQVKTVADLLWSMDRQMNFESMLRWLGTENFFFQVRVNGFRAGQDNGDSEYLSGTIGTVDPKRGSGPFREFVSKYPISAYEVYGRYLSEAQ